MNTTQALINQIVKGYFHLLKYTPDEGCVLYHAYWDGSDHNVPLPDRAITSEYFDGANWQPILGLEVPEQVRFESTARRNTRDYLYFGSSKPFDSIKFDLGKPETKQEVIAETICPLRLRNFRW